MTTTTRPLPLHPILLGAYWVLSLYAANLAEADPGQVAPVLGGVVVLTAGSVLVLAPVMRDAQRAGIVAFAGWAVFFGYTYIIAVTSGTVLQGWPVRIALLLFLGTAGAAALVRRSPLPAITRVLNVATAVLVAITVAAVLPQEITQAIDSPPAAPVVVATVPFKASEPPNAPQRDVYFIVLDRYGSERSLALNYGITDNGFPTWLEEHGFFVARESHANYVRTSHSLAATLNLAYLDDVPQGNSLAIHAVGQFLKDQGYRYFHIGANVATQTSPLADVNRRLDTTSEFARAFLDTTLYSRLAIRLGIERLSSARQRHVEWSTFQLKALADTQAEPGPKFVFVHLLLPHPPYVYAGDGGVISDTENARRSAAEGFREQLLYTNARMEELLEPLLRLPEAGRPIIVVSADEGPYPPRYDAVRRHGQGFDWDWSQATDEEIEIKFGILNALYLPGVDRAALYGSISPVNTFRLVFSRYFGAQLPLLPDRAFAPSPTHGGSIEITDRLRVGS